MLKIIFKDKKLAIILITTIIICSIAISVGIYAKITDTKIKTTKEAAEEKEYNSLYDNFFNLFNNELDKNGNIEQIGSNIKYDEIITLAYKIKQTQSGDYSINANIPIFKLETETTKKINDDINNLFISKMFQIAKKTDSYTIYNVDYAAYINYNVLSLVIKCTIKDQTNPERLIIQTYNYDIKNDKLLTIDEILKLKKLNENDTQNKINDKIEEISKQKNKISTEEYKLYQRNPKDHIYKLENSKIFFIRKQRLFIYFIPLWKY